MPQNFKIQLRPLSVAGGKNSMSHSKGTLSDGEHRVGCLDINDTQKFYKAIKTIFGLTHHSVHHVKSEDGSTLTHGILGRWAKHLSELLNCLHPSDPIFVDLLLLPIIPDLGVLPAVWEVQHAVKGLKNY